MGFSTYDMNEQYNLDCAQLIKEIDPKVKIIAGGQSATVVPNLYMKEKNIDYVCRGEGEELLIELVDALENQTPLDNILGLCWKNDL